MTRISDMSHQMFRPTLACKGSRKSPRMQHHSAMLDVSEEPDSSFCAFSWNQFLTEKPSKSLSRSFCDRRTCKDTEPSTLYIMQGIRHAVIRIYQLS